MVSKRTSEIQLAVFKRIDVGERILEEFDCQTHGGGGCRRVREKVNRGYETTMDGNQHRRQ